MAAAGAEMTFLGVITAWHGVGPFPEGVEVVGSGAEMIFSGVGTAWHGVCIEDLGVGDDGSGVWDGGIGREDDTFGHGDSIAWRWHFREGHSDRGLGREHGEAWR